MSHSARIIATPGALTVSFNVGSNAAKSSEKSSTVTIFFNAWRLFWMEGKGAVTNGLFCTKHFHRYTHTRVT